MSNKIHETENTEPELGAQNATPSFGRMILEHPWFFYPYFGLLLLGALLLGLFETKQLFFAIHQNLGAFWNSFFYYGTYLGDGVMSIALVLFLCFVRFRLAIAAAVSFLLQTIIVQVLKNVVFGGQPRPFKVFTEYPDFNFIEGVKLYNYGSFPSGHTATGFVIFGFLALVIKRPWASLVCLVLAIEVAISRIYLGQHFFLDVYVGSMIGVGCAMLGYWYLELVRPGKLLKGEWMERKWKRS